MIILPIITIDMKTMTMIILLLERVFMMTDFCLHFYSKIIKLKTAIYDYGYDHEMKLSFHGNHWRVTMSVQYFLDTS